jgi:hypothetical protein
MTLVTTTQTTDSAVSSVRATLLFDNSASLVGGTDYTIEATWNGGTNWTAAATYNVATGQGGHRVVETDDIACTSGTSVGLRIKTLTGKNMPIDGDAWIAH